MPVTNVLTAQPLQPLKTKKPYEDISQAILGQNTGFSLPQNYDFNTLANYEVGQRNALGQSFQDQIGQLRTGVQSQYDDFLKSYQDQTTQRRNDLAKSLSDNAQQTFKMNNPFILEDLNNRGVFSSPTAIASAQAQALKELELGNQKTLLDFDNQARAYQDQLSKDRLSALTGLDSSGVSANMQAQQDALDSGLDIRRTNLESDLQKELAAREESLARELANQQAKNQLTSGLIGAGGSIIGGILGGGGGLGSILSGIGGAIGSGTAGAGTGAAAEAGAGAAAGAGGASALLPIAGAAAGLGAYEETRKMLDDQGVGSDASKALATMTPIGLNVGIINKALGGKLFGGKTADGNAIAEVSRGLDSIIDEMRRMKEAVANGELTQEEFNQLALPMVSNAAQAVGNGAKNGSVWADNMNAKWRVFLDEGFASSKGNQWMLGNTNIPLNV